MRWRFCASLESVLCVCAVSALCVCVCIVKRRMSNLECVARATSCVVEQCNVNKQMAADV